MGNVKKCILGGSSQSVGTELTSKRLNDVVTSCRLRLYFFQTLICALPFVVHTMYPSLFVSVQIQFFFTLLSAHHYCECFSCGDRKTNYIQIYR